MKPLHQPCRIACIGECMIELSPAGKLAGKKEFMQQSFAGDTLNTAIYLARSLEDTDHKIFYATAVGHDALSEAMLKSWQHENIDCSLVARTKDKNPGLYAITVDQTGERSFMYWRKDSAATQMFTDQGLNASQTMEITTNIDILYFSGITLAILDERSQTLMLSMLARARKNGAKLVFDSNYRPSLWSSPDAAKKAYNKVLSIVDVALVTFDDEKALFGDPNPDDTLHRLSSIKEVVVKDGAKGCLVKTDHENQWIPANEVKNVTDTTAAGDSFNGAYLAARAKGFDPVDAAKAGHRMASTVIQHKGAIIPKTETDKLVGQ